MRLRRNALPALLHLQVARLPCPDRMGLIQPEVTPAMRTTLVDWLGEVRDEFRLHSETLFLAVAYLDRFLAYKPVSRGRFQLLGLACVWVAAKFEEVYPPPMAAMLAMAENMYSANDLRAMEKEVLFTLDFGLAVPTSLRFLHYLLQITPLPAHPADATAARRLAESLLELSLLDTTFLGALPSHVAASAVYLALGLLRGEAEGLRAVMVLSRAEPHTLGALVKRLSQVLRDAAAQPQPCALLLRFRAWQSLHGDRCPAAAAVAAAPAPPPIHAAGPMGHSAAMTAGAVGTAVAQQPPDLLPRNHNHHNHHQHQQHCPVGTAAPTSAPTSAVAVAATGTAGCQALAPLCHARQVDQCAAAAVPLAA
ncbi:hypothetical protein PLESTF_001268800 [Pleodorina starrii]|nr:hypothetical protein PLESTF_001268800 [Pleodorina starrii]